MCRLSLGVGVSGYVVGLCLGFCLWVRLDTIYCAIFLSVPWLISERFWYGLRLFSEALLTGNVGSRTGGLERRLFFAILVQAIFTFWVIS